MMGLASRTDSARNVAALKEAGWGWIVGPLDKGDGRLHGMAYALDNGAWPAHAQGIEWNEAAFLRALDRFGPEALFVVVPDVVADRDRSLQLTRHWLPILLARPDLAGVTILIAVQDGMTFDDIEPLLLLDDRIGIFIGGSTEWKLQAIIPWGRWAKARGRYVHVGRVNTSRRIALCAAGLADSFDGTSVTRFAKNLPKLDGARRQRALL